MRESPYRILEEALRPHLGARAQVVLEEGLKRLGKRPEELSEKDAETLLKGLIFRELQARLPAAQARRAVEEALARLAPAPEGGLEALERGLARFGLYVDWPEVGRLRALVNRLRREPDPRLLQEGLALLDHLEEKLEEALLRQAQDLAHLEEAAGLRPVAEAVRLTEERLAQAAALVEEREKALKALKEEVEALAREADRAKRARELSLLRLRLKRSLLLARKEALAEEAQGIRSRLKALEAELQGLQEAMEALLSRKRGLLAEEEGLRHALEEAHLALKEREGLMGEAGSLRRVLQALDRPPPPEPGPAPPRPEEAPEALRARLRSLREEIRRKEAEVQRTEEARRRYEAERARYEERLAARLEALREREALRPEVEALEEEVDFLIVHHGLFWGKPFPIVGHHKRRLETLFQGGINLYAAHLPLDAHEEVGNNFVLARELGLVDLTPWDVGVKGRFPQPTPLLQVADRLGQEVIEFVGVTKSFGDRVLIDNLSLRNLILNYLLQINQMS